MKFYQHGHDNQPKQSEGQEDFPAQTHDLVITITGKSSADPEVEKEENAHFGEEPN
jgi:hypothetical protein